MTLQLSDFALNAGSSPENPYLPFAVALESGMFNNPAEIARPAEVPPGVDLANGYIPNAREAGLVSFGDEVLAFDLVAIEVGARGLITVRSISKDSVSNDGKAQDEGIIAIQSPNGLIRFPAVAVNVRRNPWLAYELGFRAFGQSNEDIAVLDTGKLDLPDHEIKDIDVNAGELQAKPRLTYL